MNQEFNVIDFDKWERKQEYEYFSRGGCNFSLTAKVKITNLYKYSKKNNLKFYPLLVAVMAKVVNSHIEFRYGFKEGQFGYYSVLHPIIYDITESKNAKSLIVEYNDDVLKTIQNINDTREKYKDSNDYLSQETIYNTVMISVIPWVSFEGLSFELQYGFDFLKPIITFGKYYEHNGEIIIPLSVYCNHKVNDGYHASLLINEFEESSKRLKVE